MLLITVACHELKCVKANFCDGKHFNTGSAKFSFLV